MLKYSKSQMHTYKTIAFFKGKNKSKNSIYKYDESISLFAEENLASNLIEYDTEDVLDLTSNIEIKTIINDLNVSFKEEILTIVFVRLVDEISSDIEIEYDKSSTDIRYMNAILNALEAHGGFKLASKEIGESKKFIQGINNDEMRLFVLNISNNFYETRKEKLSEHLIESFDPKRYVDTSIAMFLLMAALPSK